MESMDVDGQSNFLVEFNFGWVNPVTCGPKKCGQQNLRLAMRHVRRAPPSIQIMKSVLAEDSGGKTKINIEEVTGRLIYKISN